MTPRPFIVALAALAIAAPALAAEPAAPLTWRDTVRLAAQNHPDLLAALAAEKAGQYNYYASFSGILPHLSLENSYTKRNKSGVATVVGTGQTGTVTSGSESWQAQGTASLNVLDVGQWASIRSSKAAYRQSQANTVVTSAATLLALYKAFASTLYAQDEAGVARTIEDLWRTNASMITLRYNSGRESKGNKMRTDAQLLQAQTDVVQSARDLRVAQQSLSQAIGANEFQALSVTGTWTTAALPEQPPNLDLVIENEPRLLAQKAAIQQAQAGVQSAYASLLPTLSLSYSRGYQDQHEFPTANPYWTFTGLLSYPLFGNGPIATYFGTAAANRTLEKTEQDLRSIRNQVRSDLESAWSGYLQATDNLKVQKAFLSAARQRRQESDIRYQDGLMTFEEWQIVVTEQVNFEKSFLKAEQDLLLAEAQWRFASGQPLGAFL